MYRFPIALALAAFTLTGCHNTTQTQHPNSVEPLRTPDQATLQFQQVVAQQCPAKHLENMSGQDLHTEGKIWINNLDAPAQDLYRLSIEKSCNEHKSQPDCFNVGILRAAIQDGSLNRFVTQVCAANAN